MAHSTGISVRTAEVVNSPSEADTPVFEGGIGARRD